MPLVTRGFGRLGWLLLGALAGWRRGASVEEAFTRLWSFFRRFRFAFKVRQYYCNPYGAPIENIVLCKVLRVLRAKYPDFRPQCEVANPGLIAKIVEPDAKTILVTVHNEISTSILEVLQSNGARCSLMTISPTSSSFTSMLGGTLDFRTIRPGLDVLLKARRDLGEGRIICCHPDTVRWRTINIADQHFIKTGIFEYARKVDARIFYALAQVSDGGGIVVHLEEPRYVPSDSSAVDMARDFASFLHSVSRARQTWYVNGG